jgi:hypothetical protein
VNGATLASDRYGNLENAYAFNGVDDRIRVSHDPSIEFEAESFSISLWMKTENDNDGFLIDKDHNNTPSGLYRLFLSSGIPNMQIASSTQPAIDCTAVTNVTDGQWHHVVGVRDTTDGELRIYIDTNLENNINDNASINTNNGHPLAIGAFSEIPGRNFNGAIDDIRIYNRALSENEIMALHVLATP